MGIWGSEIRNMKRSQVSKDLVSHEQESGLFPKSCGKPLRGFKQEGVRWQVPKIRSHSCPLQKPSGYYIGKGPTPTTRSLQSWSLAGFLKRAIYEETDRGLVGSVWSGTPGEPLLKNCFSPLSAINTEIPLLVPSFFHLSVHQICTKCLLCKWNTACALKKRSDWGSCFQKAKVLVGEIRLV